MNDAVLTAREVQLLNLPTRGVVAVYAGWAGARIQMDTIKRPAMVLVGNYGADVDVIELHEAVQRALPARGI